MTDDEKAWGQEFVAKAVGDKYVKGLIVVHLGSEGSEKRWPGRDATNILALAVERGYHCFLFDHYGIVDKPCPAGVTMVRSTRLCDVASVVSACDIVLCVDRIVFNICKSMKKRVMPLFGSMPEFDAMATINTKFMRRGCGDSGRGKNCYTPDPVAVLDAMESGCGVWVDGSVSTLEEIKTVEI